MLANTTWGTLHRAEADCCVPRGPVDTVFDVQLHSKDMSPTFCDQRKLDPLMVCCLVGAYYRLFLAFPLSRVLVIAGGFNPWPYW